MKTALRPFRWLPLALLATGSVPTAARAQSTVNATAAFAWGANVGWTNWRPSTADGVTISEFVCSGYLHAANVGWIDLGRGTPADGVRYRNDSATDYGVNFLPTATPGVAALRGMAYGANIGWVNFEDTGNATVNLQTGQFAGYAWGANVGWINLGTGTVYAVKTDTVAPGADANGNGVPDAWERQMFGNLTSVTATSDADGDGVLDRDEYLAGTDPRDGNDRLRILSVARTTANNVTSADLVFTTVPSRFYRVEQRDDLRVGSFTDSPLGLFAPDAGATTQRMVNGPAAPRRFYRVVAVRPLAP